MLKSSILSNEGAPEKANQMGALAEEAVADLATPLWRVPRTVSLFESAPTLLAKRRIGAATSSISPYFTKQRSE